MPAADRLVGAIHPALNTDPEATAVLRFNPTTDVTILIDAATLTVILPLAQQTYPLDSFTLSELSAALPSALGALLLMNDWASVGAVCLVPQRLSLLAGGTGDVLAYTSGLWRTIRPIGAALDALADRVDTLIEQMDVYQAVGPWLDLWGLIWHIPRVADEGDVAYRRRIIYSLTLPRANNRALEALILRALGRSATVNDGGGSGLLTWNEANTWGPTGTAILGPQQYGTFVVTLDAAYEEDVSQLLAIIGTYKAAGTSFTINTRYAPEASVGYGDIVVTTG